MAEGVVVVGTPCCTTRCARWRWPARVLDVCNVVPAVQDARRGGCRGRRWRCELSLSCIRPCELRDFMSWRS